MFSEIMIQNSRIRYVFQDNRVDWKQGRLKHCRGISILVTDCDFTSESALASLVDPLLMTLAASPMRAVLTLTALTLLTSLPVLAQESTADLPDDQRAALWEYLRANPRYSFVRESQFEWLEWSRERDPSFRPYYAEGDFNSDRVGDFAMIVFGPRSSEQGGWGFRDSFRTKILVFEGLGDGGFRIAHDATEDLPLATFFHFDAGHNRLGYGVSETGFSVRLVSAGTGYIREYEGD